MHRHNIYASYSLTLSLTIDGILLTKFDTVDDKVGGVLINAHLHGILLTKFDTVDDKVGGVLINAQRSILLKFS